LDLIAIIKINQDEEDSVHKPKVRSLFLFSKNTENKGKKQDIDCFGLFWTTLRLVWTALVLLSGNTL